MPIHIENVSESPRKYGPQTYTIRVNDGPVLTTVEHNAERPLWVLLQRLSLACRGVVNADERKRLRAHWPPRETNTVAITLSRELYEDVYHAADKAEHSFQDEVRKRIEEYAEYDELFELQWKADRRAIELWQKETGREDVWPGHTELVLWLMHRIDELEQRHGDG